MPIHSQLYKILRLITISSFCWGTVNASSEQEALDAVKVSSVMQKAALSLDDIITRTPLVHGTSHLPVGGVQTIGLNCMVRKPEGEIIPRDSCFRTRATGHYCLGGVVPPHEESWDHKPYWIIECFEAFAGKVYGGVPEDIFFIAGTHQLSAQSLFLAPDDQQETVISQLQGFKGELVFYPAGMAPRDFIDSLIKQRGWLNLKYGDFDEKKLLHKTILINDQETVDAEEAFSAFFESQKLWKGLHSRSRLMQIEDILSILSAPFMDHFLELEAEEGFCYPDSIKKLRGFQTILAYNFKQLRQASFNSATLEFIEEWQKEVAQWVRILELDLSLQSKNKASLFKNKPLLLQCIQHRHDENALQAIALEAEHVLDSVTTLSPQAEGYFNIANYLNLMPLQEVKEVSLLLEQEGYDPALIIVKYISQHFQNGRLNENLIKGLDDYKGHLSEQHRASMGSLGLFSLFIADEEEHHVTLLKTLNTTALKACFGYLLNTQEFDHRDVTFNDVLKYDFTTNSLYQPSCDLSLSSFVAAKLRIEQPKTFKDAHEKATLYMRYGAELQTPLNTFSHESTEGDHVYTLIKNGEFGTLAEIFALLGLSEGFEKRFPTEEEFWASSQSFQEIIWSLKNNFSY